MLAADRKILAGTPLLQHGEPERGRVGLLVTCCAVNTLYAIYFGAIGVLLPAIGAAFQVGSAAQGRLFPANFAGMIASVLISGTLSDRFGRQRVMLGGAALFGIGLFLFGAAPGFGMALLAAPLIGAGSGGMVIVGNALVSDLFPERRAVLLNATQVMFGVGAAAGADAGEGAARHGRWLAVFVSRAGGRDAGRVSRHFLSARPETQVCVRRNELA